MATYESELTGFLRTLKQQDPELEEKQREGRALWWDRTSDAEDVDRWEKARPPRGSYVYYSTGKAAS
jgi:hypothetical protein